MSDPFDDSKPAILFEDAKRSGTKVLMAIVGPSGTGKTPAALQMARGMIGPRGKLYVVGTEGERAQFYADRVQFKHARVLPPYTPDRIAEHIEAAAAQGADAIVIDSGSDVFEGLGGIKDMAGASKLQTPLNWSFPKDRHRKMIQRIINCPAHVLITFRADEKIEVIDDPDKPGKKKIVPKGWTPIWEKTTPYWMQVSLMLLPTEQLGDLAERRFYRCDDDLRPIFLRPGRLDEATGADLASWISAGQSFDRHGAELKAQAIEAAEGGMAALKEYWDGLDKEARRLLQPDWPAIKAAAAAVDEERARHVADAPAEDFKPDVFSGSAEFWDQASYEVPLVGNDWRDWDQQVRATAEQAPNGDCIAKLSDDCGQLLKRYQLAQPQPHGALLRFLNDLEVSRS